MQSMYPSFLQYRQPPTTLETFLSDMLLADAVPDLVVFGKLTPVTVHLSGFAEGDGVEVA